MLTDAKLKLVLVFLLIYIAPLLYAQGDSTVTFTEVVPVEAVKQQQLFTSARTWAEKTFSDPKAAINIADKEAGEITGKGLMNFNIAYQGRSAQIPVSTQFRFSIRVKDGKYKYEFTDFDIVSFWNTYQLGILRSEKGKDWFGTKKWSEIAYQETKSQVEQNTHLLIASLKREMIQSIDF
jgi:hypothetical protein